MPQPLMERPLKSLVAHENGIVMDGKTYRFSVVGYKTFKLGGKGSFIAQARCPVELLALDAFCAP